MMLYIHISEGLREHVTTLNIEDKDLTKQLLSTYETKNERLNLFLYSLASKPPTS